MAMDTTTNDTSEKFLECGLCYESDDLKRLPCNLGHIFCVKCLTKAFEASKVIQRSYCRSVQAFYLCYSMDSAITYYQLICNYKMWAEIF